MRSTNMTSSNAGDIQLETMRQRLARTEQMLFKATMLADHAYLTLETGNLEECQTIISQLIYSISEHFHVERH